MTTAETNRMNELEKLVFERGQKIIELDYIIEKLRIRLGEKDLAKSLAVSKDDIEIKNISNPCGLSSLLKK
jgi:hypothetical protein